MGKYSSDSDSEKRKSSYKSRTKHRSSSSSSSESRSRKRRHKDRSRSRDRYSKSRRSRSSSVSRKSKSRRRSRSRHRDRYRRHRRSRSRSRSYIKEYTSKPRRRSTSSSSEQETKNEDNVRTDVRKSPEVSKVDPKALNAINEEGFTPKGFSSSKSKKMDNIVIDLKKQTIKVPEVEPVEPDSIFHHSLFLNEEARMEKWIKELYGYRQKALQQGLKTGDK